ncbi:MAG: MurR/RpiR family transcriptional regulator [Chloroflexi bacterium]|uniref:MurR/RpiR family transcriptional regulator n=1 Tax=Candidatus Flexifilum breve TaxID=3140694 RepID=UPI003136BA16|nr:MurR/RpiR family transcriptional regulator [Chloroflexota bacterium]
MNDKQRSSDIVEHLRTLHDSLSDSQRAVIEFLLTHGVEAIYMSSSQIAEHVAVNRSTVIRTAQAVGFAGFSELQTALQQHFSRQYGGLTAPDIGSHQLLSLMETGDHTQSVLQRMVSIELEKLKSLPDIIPAEDFERAVHLLVSAQRVGIVGLYLSKSLALNLYYPLTLMRSGCLLLEPEATSFVRDLGTLTAGDVLFAISNTRYARVTLQSMEQARAAGATVIALTDSLLSPAAKRADLSLVVPPKLWFYGNSVVPSTLLNALCASLLLHHSGGPSQEINVANQIFTRFNTFIDGDD